MSKELIDKIDEIKKACDAEVDEDNEPVNYKHIAFELAHKILSIIATIEKNNKPKQKAVPIILVEDPKYAGRYVALKSLSDRTVIADGTDHNKVVEEVTKMGYGSCPIIYVPKEGETWFY